MNKSARLPFSSLQTNFFAAAWKETALTVGTDPNYRSPAALPERSKKPEKPKHKLVGRKWLDAFMAEADKGKLPHPPAL
ncbi:hypothetical protein NKJ26_13765 [Mesorhizobium sp. M0152]|uniref:hypothetical protein n=1 Tax=unclassified Mesorhizobium TaxID=325217 RepID=UPI003339319A